MSYFVYILTNKSSTLYIGVTNNLLKRVEEHSLKAISSFTQRYNIDKLVYFQEFNNVIDAIAAEKRIKGWTRKKKMVLIKAMNPDFTDLARIPETSSEILRAAPSG